MKLIKKPISEVVDVNPRIPTNITSDLSREIDFVPMAQLSEQGFVRPEGSRPLGEVLKGYTYFENGDVLVAKITPCMENGKAAFVDNLPHQIGFGSTEFHVLRPSDSIDGRYLFYMIWNSEFRNEAEGNMTGSAGQKRVPKTFFDRFEIPLPPLSEQKRIADILDKADAIRRKRQEAIDQFGALTESLFHEMFSHKLSSVRWTDLSEYLVELRYGTSNRSGEDGFTTLRIPNIVRGIIDLSDLKTVGVSQNELTRLKLLEGDVLFVRTNGNPDYVGRCAVFETSQMEAAGLGVDEIIYASYLIRARLKLDRIRPLFLQSLLQTPAGRRNVREKCRTSAGQYNINTKGIGALQVPVVAVEEQIDFETRIRSFRPALTSLTAAHLEADTLFNSLGQRAFKGELL
ncbi:MAG: restriction endonuclease subunit S [Planctomycetaceae bacterium]|nr:restriction endonuclease subunit S [Planctomycetaceae bacterium]